MSDLPLFPLSAVLLPYGRMPLQIFEQRYLDLVRDCMKSDTGFGVVWLQRGSEVASPGAKSEFGEYGTVARIIDWDQLPNGLLGITIEGRETFTVRSSIQRENGLHVGQVKLNTTPAPAPVIPAWDSLVEVLRSLESHPHVQRMALDIDYNNAWQVGYTLVQLLPLEESLKYELLSAPTLELLMRELDIVLNEISGESAKSE